MKKLMLTLALAALSGSSLFGAEVPQNSGETFEAKLPNGDSMSCNCDKVKSVTLVYNDRDGVQKYECLCRE